MNDAPLTLVSHLRVRRTVSRRMVLVLSKRFALGINGFVCKFTNNTITPLFLPSQNGCLERLRLKNRRFTRIFHTSKAYISLFFLRNSDKITKFAAKKKLLT